MKTPENVLRKAKRLFETTKMTGKQIAYACQVDENTISRNSKKGKWKRPEGYDEIKIRCAKARRAKENQRDMTRFFHAKKLYTETDMSHSEISEATGYDKRHIRRLCKNNGWR